MGRQTHRAGTRNHADGPVPGSLEKEIDAMRPPLRLLRGCAERLGALGVPLAQLYAKAAETSLSQAIEAALHVAEMDRRVPPAPRTQAIDPRLIEWLE